MPILTPGMVATVVVKNRTEEPRDFRAAFRGYTF